MKIPLFIPYVNRRDLLERAVRSAQCGGVEVNILDNSDGTAIGIPGTSFIYRRPTVPLTFAQTQNWMLNIAEGDADYGEFYLFMHSDAEAEGDSVHRLIVIAEEYTRRGEKWGAIFTAYDALAAFNTEAMRAIGGWDKMLSWYCADNDCYRRLRLAGYPTLESNLPVKHTPSQTLNSDPLIRRQVDLEIPFRESYYRAKWGDRPGSEAFIVPFNGKGY